MTVQVSTNAPNIPLTQGQIKTNSINILQVK